MRNHPGQVANKMQIAAVELNQSRENFPISRISLSLPVGNIQEGDEGARPDKEFVHLRPPTTGSPSTGTVIFAKTCNLLNMIRSGGLSTNRWMIGITNSRAYCRKHMEREVSERGNKRLIRNDFISHPPLRKLLHQP
jgi:hypothetical protein